MKLFIAAALIAVAAAGRLEHLERSYLPPDHSHGQQGFNSQGFGSGANGQSSFGANGHSSSGANGHSSSGAHSGHGSAGSSGSFGSSGSLGSGFDANVIDAAGSFPGATSNQYLPPNYGSSGSNGQFGGSLNGLQRSQYTPQSSFRSQYPNQYGSASSGLGQSQYQPQQFGANGNAGINRQFPSASNQYLTPKSNYPQQPFDEQTGYHY